jgi:hypothetical protein
MLRYRDPKERNTSLLETCDNSFPQTASITVEKNAGVSMYVTIRPEALPGLDTEISTDRQRERVAMQIVSLPAFAALHVV